VILKSYSSSSIPLPVSS